MVLSLPLEFDVVLIGADTADNATPLSDLGQWGQGCERMTPRWAKHR